MESEETLFRVKNKRLYLLSIAIAITGFFIFKNYLFFNKLYLYSDTGADTYYSYYPYLYYVINSIWTGEFSLWSFNFGVGTSLLSMSTLLLDPFNIILLIFGKNHLVYSLMYVAIFKILLAGIFFYLYISNIIKNKNAAVIVSFLYAFNGYIILWGQHYHFATIMVLAPLLLYSFEVWLKKSKWKLFLIIITIFASYSFYLFYMMTFYLVIYAAFRYLEYNKFKLLTFAKFFIKTLGIYLLGICMSAIFLFPSLDVVLSSPRLNGNLINNNILDFNTLQFYITAILRFFSNDILGTGNNFYGYGNYYEAPILYSSLLILILIPQFYINLSNRSKTIYTAVILILISFLIFPYFSIAMNGFSIDAYRWTFILILFICFLASKSFENLYEGNINKRLLIETLIILCLIGFSSILAGAIIFDWKLEFILNSLSKFKYIITFLLLYTTLLLMWNFRGMNKVMSILLIVLLSVELISFSSISVNNRDVISSDIFEDKVGYFDFTNEAIDFIEKTDNDFYRVDKAYTSVFFSDSLIQDYKGIKSYNSLNQANYLAFLTNLSIPFEVNNSTNYITGLGSRFKIQTLLGVKYYLVKEISQDPPYGFEYVNKFGDVMIYQNKYALPLGFTYDSYIDTEEFMKLSVNQKDEMLLKGFVIDHNYKNINLNAFSHLKKDNIIVRYGKKVEMAEESMVNIQTLNNTFPDNLQIESLTDDPQIIIPLRDKNGEQKLKIHFNITSDYETMGQIFWSYESNFSEEKSKSFKVDKGKKQYILEIGNEWVDTLRLDVANTTGYYTIDDFWVESQGIGPEYKIDIEKLNTNVLKLSSFNNNHIMGEVDIDKKKMLFLSIPYDRGWTAKVDGHKSSLLKINVGFMGILLDEGHHVIELNYTPPYFMLGAIVSLVSIMFFFALHYYLYRNKRKPE